ncbi:MAG: adenosylmethionine--8-amino-7-oxononanoate transaminase [Proteobacteria bacterium]|nr:adenosylmethionine--8-amino-7-oxononanoate transaminase [Pseudomonadota bacterium]MCP4919691.1 adenosylmethionine--8-amino-7-oxononanoate transaminase [Pseudomonadota bacterium]
MDRPSLAELDRAHVWHPFTQADEWEEDDPLVVERAEGRWLFDTRGRKYLDACSSLWVSVHGHRHPTVDAAVRAQLDRVAHTTLLGLASGPSVQLAAALCARTGFDRVFYSDSGSTAVEIALKMAFQWHAQRGDTGRTRFAALAEAYHGDTIGAVSVGGIGLFHAVYGPLLMDVLRLPCPNGPDDGEAAVAVQRIEAAGDTLAAVIVEPLVQGAAGMRMHGREFLEPVLTAARRVGALTILDEVAVGVGRLGTFLATEQLDHEPDFVCLGKGLTNGYLPLAATLTRGRIYDGFRGDHGRTFFHGHTFTGNALACAAATACLEVFEAESTLDNVQARSTQMGSILREVSALESVASVRQKGMMAAIDLTDTQPRAGHRFCLAMRSRGVLMRPLGNTLVLMPPLSITDEELLFLGTQLVGALSG